MTIQEKTQKPGIISRISVGLVIYLEKYFYWYGKVIASNPLKFIIFSLLITGLSSLGFLNFHMEQRPHKLWLPETSDFVKNIDWQSENFPNDVRMQLILYESDNILTPEYFQFMYKVKKRVEAITVKDVYDNNATISNVCFRVPALSEKNALGSLISRLDNDLDWSLQISRDDYCTVYSSIPSACLQLSLLDMWEDDIEVIESLTQQAIIDTINTRNISVSYSYPIDFKGLLGEITYNATGYIVGARSALHQWVMEVNRTSLEISQSASDVGLTEKADVTLHNWEGEFISTVLKIKDVPSELSLYVQSQRSFGEISSSTIFGDVTYLVISVIILFVYVQVMLGKFNKVETRPVLSVIGLMSVFMATCVAFGVCSALGLPYSPVHNIIPLLLLGLGVDDMFVIVQNWNNLNLKESKLKLAKRVGLTLSHAGVAITVTSVTDFAAFAIGATTVLPALRSFCIYSAVGVIALYLFQTTYFVSWFTFDQRRVEDKRNGLIWCIKHPTWKPNKYSQIDLCRTFFKDYFAPFILKKYTKVFILLFTSAMLGTAIWGLTTLRQEFNPIWFIPQSTYLFKFLIKMFHYYPELGERGSIFIGNLDYPSELDKISNLTFHMKENIYISSVDSWYNDLMNYINLDDGTDMTGLNLDYDYFYEKLGKFLYSQSGAKYQKNFMFENNTFAMCNQSANRIVASKFDYSHTVLNDRNTQIQAMDQIKELVKKSNFSDYASAIAWTYSSWETDKVITYEMYKNLTLAMGAVLFTTVILLASLVTSFYVMCCVVMTIINVMALMSWWGLTIDTVSCINLVLCIGLCIDYSAHIGLHFMQVCGTKDERVVITLGDMGPAVLNGAISTFLAFVCLMFSDSHVFLSFFKITFGVFIYGVYHSLVFLPVLLSLIGPKSYPKYGLNE